MTYPVQRHGGDVDVPDLVAIPGTLCAPAVFDALRHSLAGQVSVTAVSWMSGDGPWSIPDVAGRIADLIDGRGSGPALIAGHSTGGAIALWLAAHRPDVVAGLALMGTGAHMRGHGDVDSIIDRVENQWGPDLWAAVIGRSFAVPLADEVASSLMSYAAGVPQAAASDILRSQRDLDLGPRLAGLRVPALVLHGTEDPTRSVRQARELAMALPDAELCIVDAGHSPMHEVPDITAAAVLRLAARARRSAPCPT